MSPRDAGASTRPARAAVRALAVCAAAVTLSAGALTASGPALAHVHAVSPGAARGTVALVTFEVPNESPTGSATTELTVTLPGAGAARTEARPGWAVRLDRDAATGIARSVTWTADPGGGIGANQFGLFRISMKLPDADTVSFPAVQRYADGTVVHWDQPPRPDGGEPDHPAAILTLAAGPASPAEDGPAGHPQTSATPAEPAAAAPVDNGARVLAGVALLLAAVGVAAAVVRRRA